MLMHANIYYGPLREREYCLKHDGNPHLSSYLWSYTGESMFAQSEDGESKLTRYGRRDETWCMANAAVVSGQEAMALLLSNDIISGLKHESVYFFVMRLV